MSLAGKDILYYWCLRIPFAGLACVFLLCGSGCHLSKNDGPRAAPSREGLVGTWVPDELTRRKMRDEGGYDPGIRTELVIDSDGTYKLNNMPDWWWHYEGQSQKTFRSENGKWEITTEFDHPVLSLSSHGQQRVAEFFCENTAACLRFSFGHIDDNRFMTLIKEK